MRTVSVFCVLFCSAVAQQCTTGIGHPGKQGGTTADASREDAFYINRGDPAGCDGTITSVSFCFYNSILSPAHFYSTTFAVYRHQGGNTYNAISAPREIRISLNQYNSALGLSQNFGCSTMDLAEPIMIQQGDVLGICVVDRNDESGSAINRLELAGSPQGGAGDLLRISSAPSQCRTSTVPSSITSAAVSTNDVYLSANIEPPPTTVVDQECAGIGHPGKQGGTTADARREDVFYINRGDPAGCDGTITSVSFCFYTSTLSPAHHYSTTFAVYRHQGGNTYNAISAPREIRISLTEYNSVLGLPQNFGCSTMDLDEPIMIEQGDVLGICVVDRNDYPGVVINRLELAGSDLDGDGLPAGDLLRISSAPSQCRTSTVPSSITSADTSTNYVYLSANIEPIISIITQPPPITPEATTLAPTTPEATTQGPTTPEATTQGPTTPEATTQGPTTPEATTLAPTTPEATTQGPTTTIDPFEIEVSAQETTQTIAAVIVILLLVVAVAAIIVASVVVLWVKKKNTDSKDLRRTTTVIMETGSSERQPKFGVELTENRTHEATGSAVYENVA